MPPASYARCSKPVLTWQVRLVLGPVGEVEARGVDAQAQPGHLVVDLQVDALVGLDADHLRGGDRAGQGQAGQGEGEGGRQGEGGERVQGEAE